MVYRRILASCMLMAIGVMPACAQTISNLQNTRRGVSGALDLPMPDAVRHAEDVYLNQLMATEDADEGLKAVMAKRKPVWKDR